MIEINKIDDSTFEVTVAERSTTRHRVTVASDYHQKLTGGKISPQQLVQMSFEFLLDRESNSSILSSFDLPTINRYFPEYEQEMRKRIK